jgi:hypothetical protein
VDDAALAVLGVRAVARPRPGSLHLLLAPSAGSVAQALQARGVPEAA